MSNLDHIEINNALNNYYGNKMKLYVEGSKYREEYRQKMKEQKELVEELSIKAEAYDELMKLEEEWADECLDYIESLNESGGEKDESVLRDFDNEFAYERSLLNDQVYLRLKQIERER